jgi:hypothetical protein
MKLIKVPFEGKGYTVKYKTETIDLSMTPIEFINVHSVFIDDPVLQKKLGKHFTILQNHMHVIKPVYEIKSSGDIEEANLKKTIAQQIMNDTGS